MTNEQIKAQLEHRVNVLSGRAKENTAIIKKLKRKIRQLSN